MQSYEVKNDLFDYLRLQVKDIVRKKRRNLNPQKKKDLQSAGKFSKQNP